MRLSHTFSQCSKGCEAILEVAKLLIFALVFWRCWANWIDDFAVLMLLVRLMMLLVLLMRVCCFSDSVTVSVWVLLLMRMCPGSTTPAYL